MNNAGSTASCQTNSCQNGGTCLISNGQQQCRCNRGYIGLRCEVDICLQPALPGPCYQSVTRYYYNSHQKQCVGFTYGGCRG